MLTNPPLPVESKNLRSLSRSYFLSGPVFVVPLVYCFFPSVHLLLPPRFCHYFPSFLYYPCVSHLFLLPSSPRARHTQGRRRLSWEPFHSEESPLKRRHISTAHPVRAHSHLFSAWLYRMIHSTDGVTSLIRSATATSLHVNPTVH